MQAAAVAAWADDEHVDEQRARYLAPPRALRRASWRGVGVDAPMPGGGFYLWAPAPDGDAWALVAPPGRRRAARWCRPGEFYGADGAGFVRVAVVQPDDRLELVARRLGVA